MIRDFARPMAVMKLSQRPQGRFSRARGPEYASAFPSTDQLAAYSQERQWLSKSERRLGRRWKMNRYVKP
jgi:hypothetical protein